MTHKIKFYCNYTQLGFNTVFRDIYIVLTAICNKWTSVCVRAQTHKCICYEAHIQCDTQNNYYKTDEMRPSNYPTFTSCHESWRRLRGNMTLRTTKCLI